MTERDLITAARRILSNVLGVAESSIPDSFDQHSAPSWDSIAHLNLLVSLQEHFSVEFTEREALEMSSFGSIVEVLQRRVAGNH